MTDLTIEELHKFADWMNDRFIDAPHVFAAIYSEADRLENDKR